MKTTFISFIFLLFLAETHSQSTEILDILKDKLSPAKQIDNNLTNLKPYAERRETNENVFALRLMKDASKLETQVTKGIFNAKKLRDKLNQNNKGYWADEITTLIGYFNKIKSNAAIIQDNASSLYYIYNRKEDVLKYYNEMVSASHTILNNANYARETYKTLLEMQKWELVEQSKTLITPDKTFQNPINKKIIDYDTPEKGCIEGECDNGYGVYVSESGMKRQGKFSNKQLTGVGRIDSERGYYIGEFLDGFFNGFGIRMYNNGDKYMGSWQKGNKYGIGVFIKNNGSIIKGFFKNNVLTSEYVLTYTVYNFFNKTKKGCISGDCVNGYGTFYYDNGDLYVGTWRNGLKEGNGYYYWKSGNVYCGEFKQGSFEGFGSIMYGIDANFECYIGTWKNGIKQGKGTYVFRDGKYTEGNWINGKYQ
ncbi:MORN repeat-containing protein [Polaribacter sp.]|uniref:MORN repeat-containing protein n=1 Tax=Polaribacter sp. TaxID=1920175 RepID=UPI0040472AA3